MIPLNRAKAVVFVAALTLGGLGCVPEPTGTPCTTVADCGAAPGACIENTCVNKVCGTANVAAGTRVGVQTAGDCAVSQCDGAGHVALAIDDTDVPVDAKECTDDVCTGGVPSNPPRAAAAACGAGGMLKCDGQGSCVTCTAPADCGSSSECQARTCVAGTCGVDNAARGTALASQTAGDCQVRQCDGNGGEETVNDDADVRVDATTCTSDVCTAGVPSNPPVSAGATCSEGNGTLCDGAGACVACVAATDCPGTDGECQQRTCTAGVCGFSYTAVNTPLASQTARDCKKSVCDGAGGVTLANDDTDLPNDNNACTTDTCSAGSPSFANVTAGTACGTAGVCSAGVCVGCIAPSDCPGSDDECKARTCVSNVCGVTFTAVNTPVASQTPNNCRKNVCDGSGNIVNQNDDTDLPADDGNQCTSQACTNGVPSFPAVSVNTSCNQNGGSFCSAAGTCVACTAASQCPGSDTECQTRTCTNNVCGLDFTAAGFVTTAQTPNDCKENRCDGAGGVVVANKDSDVPADDGNQCTDQACNAGVPVFPAASLNTACGPGAGSFCDGNGTCVACNSASQCAGTDTDCQARTCDAHVCGFSYAAAGTPTSSQTPNDCKENQCNGSGGTVVANQDGDLPADDGNQCTVQACTAGVPSFPPAPSNTACNENGGSVCDGSGACVTCTAPSQCPGTDTECQTRTCTNSVCGFDFTAAGFVTSAQTANDCKQNQCDGAGAIVAVNLNTDLPVDDGNECTAQVCNAGVPSFPLLPVDTACAQNGGSFCSSTGACVACNVASQCAGSDTDCQTRTCSSGACGLDFAAAGTTTSSQTPGDCKVNECDGTGGIVAVNSSADTPADDGNQCTGESCTGGVPSHPLVAVDTPCAQNGGAVCSASGSCVECNSASQCPGSDTECQTRTCTTNACGFNFQTAGFVVSAQTAGDCKQAQCDGAGAITPVAFNTDLPVDGNQCTADVCTAGVPSNPPESVGTACTQSGGSVCDNTATCVLPPSVVSTTPADAATTVAVGGTVAVTFSAAMDPSTLTAQPVSGTCTGSIQVSADDFSTCLSMGTAAMSSGNTIATFTPAPGLSFGTRYKVRVTPSARNTTGVGIAATFTTPTGFTTAVDAAPGTGVVISQVYTNGGATGTYPADFVELHNRGNAPVNITNWSLQYASATGSSWTSKVSLTATVTLAPGQYYLVQTSSSTASSLNADVNSGSMSMSGSAGKVALVNNTTTLTSGTLCPVGLASVVDFVGYGTQVASTGCWETLPAGSTAPAQAATTASIRKREGCQDSADNGADFATLPVTPHRASSTPVVCTASVNEQTVASEIDYCNVQFPTSLSVQTGTATPLVYTRAYESGITEPGGPSGLVAQIGYGPISANPEYQSGWTWVAANFNAQFGNDDEYMATFTAPAVGTYAYGARFSFDGLSWTYCDLNGAGANAGLSFETNQLPMLTVTP